LVSYYYQNIWSFVLLRLAHDKPQHVQDSAVNVTDMQLISLRKEHLNISFWFSWPHFSNSVWNLPSMLVLGNCQPS